MDNNIFKFTVAIINEIVFIVSLNLPCGQLQDTFA